MSALYDQYLAKHKTNVTKAFEFLEKNLPDLVEYEGSNAKWNVIYAHDASKTETDEYEAYDVYFFGGNRSYNVVQDFNNAWLRHIHRNPHHWQYWVLINDDPKEDEVCLDMPYDYILEMICDWWSFSWKEGNLYEIFDWYKERKSYIKLSDKTRQVVEDILEHIRLKLDELKENDSDELMHHGVKGQKWGVKNGPPYPIGKSGGLKTAAGKDIIRVEHASLTGPANGVTETVRKNGGIDRNYFDSYGRQTVQISNHDHGHPSSHPYGEHGEHAHDYIYDESGKLIGRPIRELTETERKDNGDFL